MCRFLHLLIRQRVHHVCLVVYSNHQLTAMRIAERHHFTANIVLVCDALLELHLGHLAMISEFQYIFFSHIFL